MKRLRSAFEKAGETFLSAAALGARGVTKRDCSTTLAVFGCYTTLVIESAAPVSRSYIVQFSSPTVGAIPCGRPPITIRCLLLPADATQIPSSSLRRHNTQNTVPEFVQKIVKKGPESFHLIFEKNLQ